ncbi:MAG: hypothetical protein AB1716_14495 [Planctomycetota bacterium]
MSTQPVSSSLLPADSPAMCLGCGYRLRGLTQPRCPECGRAFDPRDPATWRRPSRRWEMAEPPGRLFHIPLAALCGWLLIQAGWPGESCFTLSVILVVFALMSGWTLGLLAFIGCALLRRPESLTQWALWRKWLKAPSIVAALILLLGAEVPLPAMDRSATGAMSSPVGARLPPRWIGLYRAKSAERIPGGVRFVVDDGFMGDGVGWAYSPAGRPPIIGEDHYDHIDGSWYTWYMSW